MKYRIVENIDGEFKVQSRGLYSFVFWFTHYTGRALKTIEEAREWIEQDIEYQKLTKARKLAMKRPNKKIVEVING